MGGVGGEMHLFFLSPGPFSVVRFCKTHLRITRVELQSM